MIAAGPATEEANWAANSHPAPMIEPNEANTRPTTPTSRRSLCAARAGAAAIG
jgi:hypothetical protein